MKPAVKTLLGTATLLCISFASSAQILKNIGNRAKQKAEQRANQKIDNAIDKGLDKAEDGGQKKPAQPSGGTNENSGNTGNNNSTASGENTNTSVNQPAGFKFYSKFDFIPGEKIIVYEDFSQDAVGDFPAKWNTNSTGEIVTVNNQPGRWLMVNKKGRFIPEYVTELPENFTMQFNLMSNEKFDYYSRGLDLLILTGTNGNELFESSYMQSGKRSGIKLYFHPVSPGKNSSEATIQTFEDGHPVITNDIATGQFNSHSGNNKIAVSIWRQKQRLRVYFNEEKIFDLPRAFVAGKKYSSTFFEIDYNMANQEDRFLISNFKLAVGAPDTRNKLITEGRFVTRGIMFDVNSDRIRPESYGTLKDIAAVLKENEAVKVKIIGHTDADGSDADNLGLSRRRAESVKASLVSEFEINGSRIETDGKGESQPVDKNTTAEAKANNRREEFVKL
jgi:OOP family OmpA-OmpF porin